MKLYCCRHGEAESEIEHPERPLTARGREDIARLAEHLKARAATIQCCYHSGVLRARQTSEILTQNLGLTDVPSPLSGLLGGDEVEGIVDRIQQWDTDTMIVSHLPLISRVVSQLVTGQDPWSLISFAPGTLVCLERFERQWLIHWVWRPF